MRRQNFVPEGRGVEAEAGEARRGIAKTVFVPEGRGVRLQRLVKQGEERCAELREASGGHERRCQEAASEISRANNIIQTLSVRVSLTSSPCSTFGWPACLERSSRHDKRP